MSRNVASLMQQHLPEESLALVRRAGEMASERRVKIYLVGGVVRDALLDRPGSDLDLVVEGDPAEIAGPLAAELGGRLVLHRRFGTAKVRAGSLSIDLAMARAETYARPGALPRVRPGSIQDDLARRDFTVNAMALQLDPTGFGRLVDPFAGQKDLQSGLIRVLHDRSFVDDPTRMLRAIRYEQRFGFRLEVSTEKLLRRGVSGLRTISGDRLRHELGLVLAEERPEAALRRAGELGLLARIHPSLKADERLERMFERARDVAPALLPALYYALLTSRLDLPDCLDFTTRLKTPRPVSRAILDSALLRQQLLGVDARDLKPSDAFWLFAEHRPASVLACAIAEEPGRLQDLMLRHLTEWCHVRTTLDGHDLLRMGVPPGTAVGGLLKKLHDARLDGKIESREDEEELVRRWLSRRR